MKTAESVLSAKQMQELKSYRDEIKEATENHTEINPETLKALESLNETV